MVYYEWGVVGGAEGALGGVSCLVDFVLVLI